ncbi:MAG: hypothetical protein R6U29_04215 [Desulfosudaceae bacterium]
MKRTKIIAVTMAFVVMGGLGAAGADPLVNSMFDAREKEYLSQVDQGYDFTPETTVTEKKEKMYVNTMLSGSEQDYLRAVSKGVDFSPVRTTTEATEKEKPELVNTMFSAGALDRLDSVDLFK